MLLDLLMFYILKTNFKKKCYKYLKGKDFIIAYTMMIFEYIEDWNRSHFKFIVYMFNV